MHHTPHDWRAAKQDADLLRAARAHVAETHNFILSRGRELIGLCGRFGGAKAEREAADDTSELLWVEGAAESLLVANMASRLAAMTHIDERDRHLRDDLLGSLHRLGRSAEAVRKLRRTGSEPLHCARWRAHPSPATRASPDRAALTVAGPPDTGKGRPNEPDQVFPRRGSTCNHRPGGRREPSRTPVDRGILVAHRRLLADHPGSRWVRRRRPYRRVSSRSC